MANDDAPVPAQNPVRRRAQTPCTQGLFTIKQVGDACGLPGPVIAQLVPRTWVERRGWMYTAAQLEYAVGISDAVRNGDHRPRH